MPSYSLHRSLISGSVYIRTYRCVVPMLAPTEAKGSRPSATSQESRRLIQVSLGDAEEANKMFTLLLSNDLPGWKQYITDHGEEYVDQLDID